MDKQYYVYIMTSSRNTVLYTGITNDLRRRVYEHKEKLASGFTRRYNITKLVYYEVLEDVENAIQREADQGWPETEENPVNWEYEYSMA